MIPAVQQVAHLANCPRVAVSLQHRVVEGCVLYRAACECGGISPTFGADEFPEMWTSEWQSVGGLRVSDIVAHTLKFIREHRAPAIESPVP